MEGRFLRCKVQAFESRNGVLGFGVKASGWIAPPLLKAPETCRVDEVHGHRSGLLAPAAGGGGKRFLRTAGYLVSDSDHIKSCTCARRYLKTAQFLRLYFIFFSNSCLPCLEKGSSNLNRRIISAFIILQSDRSSEPSAVLVSTCYTCSPEHNCATIVAETRPTRRLNKFKICKLELH